MGMTKARVFPLPVTCGGQGRGRLAPAAPCGGRWGGGGSAHGLTASAATSLFLRKSGMVAD